MLILFSSSILSFVLSSFLNTLCCSFSWTYFISLWQLSISNLIFCFFKAIRLISGSADMLLCFLTPSISLATFLCVSTICVHFSWGVRFFVYLISLRLFLYLIWFSFFENSLKLILGSFLVAFLCWFLVLIWKLAMTNLWSVSVRIPPYDLEFFSELMCCFLIRMYSIWFLIGLWR